MLCTSKAEFNCSYSFPVSCCHTTVQARQPTFPCCALMQCIPCCARATTRLGSCLQNQPKPLKANLVCNPGLPSMQHIVTCTEIHQQLHNDQLLVSLCGTDFSWSCSHASPSQQQTSAIHMHRCPLTRLMQHSIAGTRPTK